METHNRAAADEEVIDLQRLFYYFLQGARRFWIWGIALIIVLAIGCFAYSKSTYIPVYEATASLIVTDDLGSEQTSNELTMAAQMGKTFSYIVKSDLLKNVVQADLGVTSVNSEISASAVTGTNLLTISVQDKDPQMAYDVLNSVIKNYPSISDYVLGPTKIEIVQEGKLPTKPVNENDSFRALRAGVLSGVTIFCAAMLLYALTRKTAGTAGDIQEKTDAEFITNIPVVTVKKRSKKENEKLLVNQRSISQGFVESMRNLANRVEQDAAEKNRCGGIYMVTSTAEGEGKTTTAMNLAIILAKRQKRVLLVDADLRGAAATAALGFRNPRYTINSLLKGESPWSESVQQYRRSTLFVLPADQTSDSTVVNSLLSRKRVSGLIARARKDFDYVIIDTPPLGILADATNIAPVCDAAILVIRRDYAQLSDIQETIDRISESGTNLLGFTMNYVRGASGNYGYGYGYGNGYGYGYGYGSKNRYRNEYDDRSVEDQSK